VEDILYKVGNCSLELSLPSKNKGKFRWKTRENNQDYGNGFATTTTEFTSKSYIEWQIGYDTTIDNEKKTTILGNMRFVASNGKVKNPYELSEILFLLVRSSLVNKNDVMLLIEKIESISWFFEDSHNITMEGHKIVEILGIPFHQQNIVLPTFSYYESMNDVAIETSIQKQQYATGIQPMVYLCIPMTSIRNNAEIIGKTSVSFSSAKWVIDRRNVTVFIRLFEIFGMCSDRHKHDVLSILKLISKVI
jgi:hypothetical protein